MVRFEISQYCDDKLMITRKEDIVPPIKGLPPEYSSTINIDKSELSSLINILSDYYGKTNER